MKRILACVLLLLSAPAVAQPAIPDTAMGKVLSDYLSATNSGDAASLANFKSVHHFGVPLKVMQSFARQSGGEILLRIENSSETQIVVLTKQKNSDRISRETFREIGTAQAPKLFIQLQGIEPPAEFAVPRLTQTAALKALEEHAHATEQDGKFSGVYVIVRDNTVLAAKAFGWEDRDAKRKTTLDTKFRIGSMNKMFTAVAALQLVEAGKLSLDGTVGATLPDYPNREVAEKVTIRMLLTHTGGTGDFFGPEYASNRLSLKTHADYVALLGNRPPRFPPGSRDDYSNYGFILLGRIIEKASGQDYYDYVAQHIFAPAGMTNTASLPEDVTVPHRAVAYTWKDGWSRADDLPYRGTAAGGGYTTAGDLVKFAHALQTEKLLPGRVVADAATQHDHEGETGYGFDIGGKGLLQNYGHNGGSDGQNGILAIYPALGQTIIALSNFDPPAATNLASFYTNRMPAIH